MAEVEAEARSLAARRVHEIEQEIHEEADRRSRKILATTIQRIATDYVAESTVSVVPLPSDDMKGRIIGREGRNIRALEQATGVDLIVDDTPEVITISAFDPLRRELARRVLTRLLQDGRIHPTRIEEVVNKSQIELDQTIREEGDAVAYEANVVGLHPDLIKLLGRLKYRTSYGQNVLAHSLEVSVIAGALAAELGADVNVCKTAGLLHDIGKAVDHEVEGPHALIGADIAKRLGPLGQDRARDRGAPRRRRAADGRSLHRCDGRRHLRRSAGCAARNGRDLHQAARSARRRRQLFRRRREVVRDSGGTRDSHPRLARTGSTIWPPARLAHDVVKKIEESLEYPGQIKVTVIRETRSVDYAR